MMTTAVMGTARRVLRVSLASWIFYIYASTANGATPTPSCAADATVTAIADAAWERQLATNPATRRQLGLPLESIPDLTFEQARKDAAFATDLSRRLTEIDEGRLCDDAKVTRSVLLAALGLQTRAATDYHVTFVPYNTFNLIEGAISSQPVATDTDRRQYLHLLSLYEKLLREHKQELVAQERRGIRLSRPAIASSRAKLESMRGSASASLTPSSQKTAALPAQLREKFQTSVKKQIAGGINPAVDTLLRYLGPGYVSAAPEAVSIGQYPGGKDYYRARARFYTTLDLSPEEIHALGLKRVAEIKKRILDRAHDAGLEGDLQAIYEQVKENPRFVAKDPAEVQRIFEGHMRAIEPKLAEYFSPLPPIPYAAKRLAPEEEPFATYGYYEEPSESEPRGIYYYNASDLEHRRFHYARSLIYHELMPGHHLQLAVKARSIPALHPFRKQYLFGAYHEGWAEYAASLGHEMGLYADPYLDIGRASFEMFFAVRLVVDPGLGYYGWSLDQAKRYMRENLAQADSEIASEAIRYATHPGQALGYRIGYEHFGELRRHAEVELGPRFNIKEFHDVLLDSGGVPLDALSRLVQSYIDRNRKGTEAATEPNGTAR